ncbi:ABC transporter ATP-binding protein/permease [Brevibacillus ruminantium]|uniref:ABC transporter ATP-binding protein/permease n=1 Tax=Brevibacillus ruminantium TaxID=2950604 RepID=A0ABY4WN72_9BACL|nr:ABC transporter ATP-binding protein [Brevibacillus ruminantium]USG67270.1 ABC transporter ATP-binding protein/permease [Brevibacillus ruminantium]
MFNIYQWNAIKYVWSRSKGWLFASILFSIINGFLPFANLWVAMSLIDAVANYFQAQNADPVPVFLLLAGQFILSLVSSLCSHIKQYMDSRVEAKLGYEVQQTILKKTASVPILYYDSPDFHNHVNRVSGDGARLLAPLRTFFSLVEMVLSMGSYLTFLIVIHWSLVVVSLLTAIPIFLIQTKYGKKRYYLLKQQTPVAREAGYYSSLLKDRDTAKEIRLFNLESFFLQKWAMKHLQSMKETLLLERRQHTANIGLDALTGLFYVGIATVIIWLASQTRLSVGGFISIVQAIQGAQGVLSRISGLLASTYEENLYLKDYYTLLAFEDPELKDYKRDKECPNPIQQIILEDVSFRYYGGGEEILKNIHLKISANQKIAIVGENGSGKTTLIKCLIGLYSVTKGRVLIDGININEITKQSLNQQIAVIFQDFVRYLLNVSENIGVGDAERMTHRDEIVQAARQSGVDRFVRQLPQGYDTQLGRTFADGEDLSGGQWQRVALGRALFRNSQIVILDEPTAALDPIAEMELFKQFQKLAENKIAIFISHRMAAAKVADQIIVMKEGQIAEMGTHEELMELEQEYYRMYQSQAQWYTSDESSEKAVAAWTN